MFLCCSAVSDKAPCSDVGLGGVDGPAESVMACEEGIASSHNITMAYNAFIGLTTGDYNITYTLDFALSEG